MKRTDLSQLSRSQQASCDRFGHALAAHLSQGLSQGLPHDVTERLKVARLQAVERRRLATRAKAFMKAASVSRSGSSASLSAGDDDARWGRWWIPAVPMVALAAGLLLINVVQNDSRDAELAEVDAALLTDDLPPAAYADPGFMEFLKSSRDSSR